MFDPNDLARADARLIEAGRYADILRRYLTSTAVVGTVPTEVWNAAIQIGGRISGARAAIDLAIEDAAPSRLIAAE